MSKNDAEHYKELYEQEKEKHKKTKIKLGVKERELHDITQSNSYKIAKLLALTKHAARVAANQAKRLDVRFARMMRVNRQHVEAMYASDAFVGAFPKKRTASTAVIIHLYYTDMLPIFQRKLKRLPSSLSYDLFITIPEGKEQATSEVRKAYPKAYVMTVPNCGRDVLPFVAVMKFIHKLGYTKVLKMHSKKSPHREDGSEWRDRIIDSLLPTNKATIQEIEKALDNPKTAVIGPEGEYVSLLVNYAATSRYIEQFFTKIITDAKISRIIDVSDEYGFFAGTMFWARVDALMPIVAAVGPGDFEPELGQVDSTLAHGLERLLCLIPELQNKDIYELRKDGVNKIEYHTTNIPEWSEIAIHDS